MDKASRELVANQLRMFRKQNDLSQREVAEKLNVDASTISYYESAKRSVPSDTLKRIASLYGTTMDEILGNVRYEVKEEWMTVEKLPLPSFIRDYRLNSLFMGSFMLLFLGVFLAETLLVALGVVLMTVHGIFWINHVFFVLPKRAKYYIYSVKGVPRFNYEEKSQYKNKDLKFLLFLSVVGFMGLGLVSGLILYVVQTGLMTLQDETIVVYLFIANSGFVFYTVYMILRGKLLVDTFTETDKDRRMDTFKYGLFKLFIISNYLMVMIHYHYMGVLDISLPFSPIFHFILIQMVHLNLYMIPVIILSKHRHYKLYK